MLSEMTSRQFMEWQIYDKLDPIDESRMDRRFGKLIHALALVNGVKSVTEEACVTRFGDAEYVRPRQDWREIKAIMSQVAGRS